MIDFASGAPVTGSLDVTWNHGTPRRRGDRELFGNDRALLLD
jgi:hypothetical protein